ncbi:metallophosphoesterase [Candidatus Berkelbacteria bacterium RIFOXYA2_FULL_43_10]|uniref:Metallophosphoesterase n=1 Tax=Candidatus Berkelbacteria bacterium RIFOXYA2_FULL_43_10 TaxID=1797472 RepID=A0A1F5ECZ9_9BACT|nr:MAG: metallophosphoesterase [Candidatus Berkelbacteria bacterium RIFOXYA2_FULL_43_10]
MLKILFIGDIVGKPGRAAAKKMISELRESEGLDFVFANGENLAAGHGMTYEKYQEMVEAGIDYFTSGNHIWNNKDFIHSLDDKSVKVLRPANYPENVPGRGVALIGDDIALANLQGRVFMYDDVEDPFKTADKIIKENEGKIIIIDFHAEATSEKVALGFYLDGKVAALLGTHTHIQTSDERILGGGTAYITDLGMTGPRDSVLGVKKEIIIEGFLTQLPQSHKVAVGEQIFGGVVIEIDTKTKRALKIKRINKVVPVEAGKGAL